MSHLEKCIIDERNGFEYELIGDYYYPTGRRIVDGVMTPSEPPKEDESEEITPVGIWGQRHLQYLRENKKRLYWELFLFGQVNDYLSDKIYGMEYHNYSYIRLYFTGLF